MNRLLVYWLLPLIVCLWSSRSFGFVFESAVVSRVDTKSATIEWTTDVKTSGTMYSGKGPDAASKVTIGLDVDTWHRTYLFGLEEGEDYVFRITAREAGGPPKTSSWYGFRTLGIPKPRILKVEQKQLGKDGGVFVWHANIPVKGVFECGEDTTYPYKTVEKKFNIAHEVTLRRFYPLRRVFYRIRAEDARGLQAPAFHGEFTTAEDNIAVGAKVSGTFTRNPEPAYIADSPPILARVTDGGMNYFHNMACSGDPDEDTQWLEVDLGKFTTVGQILTYWRQLCYPQKFSLHLSLNRENWYDLGDTFDAAAGRVARSASGDPLYEHVAGAGNRIARYIRLTVPKGAPYYARFPSYNFVQIFELKVYPPEPLK